MSVRGRNSSYRWRVSNNDAPTTTPGTAVLPGASDAEGSWVEVLSALAYEAHEFALTAYNLSISAGAVGCLLDVGADPAGGTSYGTMIIASNLIVSQASAYDRGFGLPYRLKRTIPAGATVAVRIQSEHATPPTGQIVFEVLGRPSKPDLVLRGQLIETIGTPVGSLGVSFTAGNSGANGAWQSLGTTGHILRWWQLGFGISDGTMGARDYRIDLAYGDGTNYNMMIERHPYRSPATAEQLNGYPQLFGDCEVPAGATIYVRGSCDATSDTGLHALAYGCG